MREGLARDAQEVWKWKSGEGVKGAMRGDGGGAAAVQGEGEGPTASRVLQIAI